MVPDFLRKEAVDNEQADAEDFEDECEQADYMLSSDSAAFMEPEKIGPPENLIDNLDEPFSEILLKLIDTKDMTDVAVYKRAGIDRRLFAKIRKGQGYTPRKKTVIVNSPGGITPSVRS